MTNKITHLLYADHAIILCDVEVHRGVPNEIIENHYENYLIVLGLPVTGRKSSMYQHFYKCVDIIGGKLILTCSLP